MQRTTTSWCVALVLAALPGCASDEDTGGGSGGGEMVCGLVTGSGGALVLEATEARNYDFSSALAIDEVLVQPKTELTFGWGGLTTDFTLHEMDPRTDIDMIALIVWKLSRQDLAQKLNDDDLKQSDFEAIAMIYTEQAATEGRLFDFTEFGVPIDQELLLAYLDPETLDPDTHAYTVMVTTGTTPGKDTRMVHSFRLDPTSSMTHVEIANDSASLSFEVSFASLEPVSVPVGEPEIEIDWSQIMVNAMGREFDPTSITEAVVGRYDESPSELEDQFLDLDLIAEELYWGDITEGTRFSLANLTSDSGGRFQGIDDTGTWLVGLRCGTCTNPAPWFITVMEPCAEAATR